MSRGRRPWSQKVLGWWWSSLPLRVLVTTLVAATIVLVVGAFLIMQQATNGIVSGKQVAAQTEASSVLDRMQSQLDQADTSYSTPEVLKQLMNEWSSPQDRYQLVIFSPAQDLYSGGILSQSVPPALVDAVTADPTGMYRTPTTLAWANGSSAPAVAFGATLRTTQGDRFPVFFIFSQEEEVATLQVLQRAVVTTSFVLLLMLALTSWLITRSVVGPVRQASITARRLAAGELDERMPVRGTDDLASLATSMNNMASELQQQIVRLEELSRVQQQFVSDVSHELRTPLTTVRMAAELLYDGRSELTRSAARSTELMHDELDRFEALLADLLEISRFDAGAAQLSVDEVDLQALVSAEVEAQRSFADKMATTVRVTNNGDAKAQVDTRRIQRILRNLLTNAIEHGEGRPIDVTVAADDQAVAIVVRDRGVGFAAEQAALVFNRFWRADPSRARVVGGNGLGLAIAMEDALLHRGWLSAWGQPGEGARFRLVVPRRAGDTIVRSPLPLAPTPREAEAVTAATEPHPAGSQT